MSNQPTRAGDSAREQPIDFLEHMDQYAQLISGSNFARLPVGGRIRSGIKVLTRSAQANETAQAIYARGMEKRASFEAIEKKIREECNIKVPLVPKNTPYFVVHRHDFTDPHTASEIFNRYAEDLGDGPQIYKIPVIFPNVHARFILPNSLKCFTASELRYWSEYNTEGVRICLMHEPIAKGPDGKPKRHFGGRRAILRPENNGLCDPLNCPEFQKSECNLTGSVLFYIPEIPGTALIELPTTSFYAMSQIKQSLDLIANVAGRFWGTRNGRPFFYLTKVRRDVSRIDETGKAKRVKQWITTLESPIDMSELLARQDQPAELTEHSRKILEGPTEDFEPGAQWIEDRSGQNPDDWDE